MKRSTKTSLLSSILALVLCCSMLIGTTFAWFTDSVTSANNIIKSGNLDIELEYWDGDSWEDVSGKSDILTNTLWEPGVTEVAYLRVANAGSLAFKYQLGINIVSETKGVNQKGEEFTLSDYIQFGVVENVNGETGAYANREAAVAAVTDAKIISAGYTKAATMAFNGELYLALVVYMPTTVGNVANHNGSDVPKIELGINVFATQTEAEEDSFGTDYDAGAPWTGAANLDWYVEDPDATEFEINSAEQLAGLAAIVNGTATADVKTYATESETVTVEDNFNGKTIKLTSNIDLNGKNWTPIGNWDNVFQGTFDGNGYTISNLYINDPAGEGVGFIGVAEKATIKNLTLNNVKINAYSMVAGVVGAAYPATVSGCNVTGNVEIVAEWAYVAGIAGYCYYGTQVDACSVVAEENSLIKSVTRNAVGGITAWLLEGNHSVTKCTVKNLNLVGWTNVGGITGFVHYNNTIEGCSVENVTLTKTRVDGNPGIGLIAGGYSYHASNPSTLSNNNVKGATLNGTHVEYSSYNVLYGSEYGGATTANFVLDNNTVENVTNKLAVVTKIGDGIVKNSDGSYNIYNENGLKSLSGTKISGTYYLAADLDMTGYEMQAIYISGGTSELTFIGNGHTISNLTTVSANQNGMPVSALFNVNYSGKALTVSDLTFKNANVSCDDYSAVVVAYNSWGDCVITLNNVDVIGATVNGASAAGLIAYTTGVVNLTDCDVSGLSLTGEAGRPDKVGALVGTANTATCVVTATNCTNGTDYNDVGRVINGAKWNGGFPVFTTEALIEAIKNAPVGSETTIYLGNTTYAGDIAITVAALGKSGGDVVIKAMEGATPVIAGTVTLGYRNQGVGAAMYDANVTFEGITFDHADAAKHSIYVQDVKSLTLKSCKIVSDGEYGIDSARGNATGTSKIVGCTFENSAMQLLGNLATGLVIDDCTFNNSRVNVQAGNGVTVQNCVFNNTLTAANVGDSFYAIRSNATPITVKNCKLNIDSELDEVATNQAKWYLLANRGATNWTVENVAVTLTDAALAQTELVITACTSTGVINTTNLTVNGVEQ